MNHSFRVASTLAIAAAILSFAQPAFAQSINLGDLNELLGGSGQAPAAK